MTMNGTGVSTAPAAAATCPQQQAAGGLVTTDVLRSILDEKFGEMETKFDDKFWWMDIKLLSIAGVLFVALGLLWWDLRRELKTESKALREELQTELRPIRETVWDTLMMVHSLWFAAPDAVLAGTQSPVWLPSHMTNVVLLDNANIGKTTWSIIKVNVGVDVIGGDGWVYCALSCEHCGLYFHTRPNDDGENLQFLEVAPYLAQHVTHVGLLPTFQFGNIERKKNADIMCLVLRECPREFSVNNYTIPVWDVISDDDKQSLHLANVGGHSLTSNVRGTTLVLREDDGCWFFMANSGESGNSGTLMNAMKKNDPHRMMLGPYTGTTGEAEKAKGKAFLIKRGVICPMREFREFLFFKKCPPPPKFELKDVKSSRPQKWGSRRGSGKDIFQPAVNYEQSGECESTTDKKKTYYGLFINKDSSISFDGLCADI